MLTFIFYISHPNGWVSHCGFDLHFPNDYGCRASLTLSAGMCVAYLEQHPFVFLAHFQIVWILCCSFFIFSLPEFFFFWLGKAVLGFEFRAL
jgi:hypothetical protein